MAVRCDRCVREVRGHGGEVLLLPLRIGQVLAVHRARLRTGRGTSRCVTRPSIRGNSAQHAAAQNCRIGVVRVLLRAGATHPYVESTLLANTKLFVLVITLAQNIIKLYVSSGMTTKIYLCDAAAGFVIGAVSSCDASSIFSLFGGQQHIHSMLSLQLLPPGRQ